MSRGLSSGMLSAVAASNVFPALFASFDFSSGVLYLWSGYKDFSWNGHTWTGAGQFLSVDKVSEDSQVTARSVKFTLSGMPSAIITTALVADYRNRACKCYLGCFDSSGNLITSPIQIFGGLMDQMTINDSGEKCSVDMTVESRLVDLQRQRERRFTNEDQKFFYPTDTGFRYVTGLQDQTITWGQATPAPTNSASSPSGANGTPSSYLR